MGVPPSVEGIKCVWRDNGKTAGKGSLQPNFHRMSFSMTVGVWREAANLEDNWVRNIGDVMDWVAGQLDWTSGFHVNILDHLS